MDYQEFTLVLKALKHYESCCMVQEVMDEMRIKMTVIAFSNDEQALVNAANNLQQDCDSKIKAISEQITLLMAKLILERDKALADSLDD